MGTSTCITVQALIFMGGSFRDSQVNHKNNENQHSMKITHHMVFWNMLHIKKRDYLLSSH